MFVDHSVYSGLISNVELNGSLHFKYILDSFIGNILICICVISFCMAHFTLESFFQMLLLKGSFCKKLFL